MAWAAADAQPVQEPAFVVLRHSPSAPMHAADAVVEAVRDTTVSTQVPGAVLQLLVRVGDRVQAGQELVRLDAQTARLNATASAAQLDAVRAQASLADSELARQQQLFARQFISQAALERAQAQAQAAHAHVRALQAQVGAAFAQAGLHFVRAPYSGVVSEVPVALGDMATPGRPLVRLYDPAALRITASVPQTLRLASAAGALEVPSVGAGRASVAPGDIQRLPTTDRDSQTAQLRIALPARFAHAAPGMFARLWLPVDPGTRHDAAAPLRVPEAAVLRRGALTAVYVLDPQGRPRLRQVRVGEPRAGQNELEGSVPVLSGLRAGERVALDAQAAARMR